MFTIKKRVYGFKTHKEMMAYIKRHRIKKVTGWGHNKKQKNFFEYG